MHGQHHSGGGEYLGRGLREISRFPKDGPTGTHDLHDRLLHVEALAERSGADWILVNDADEIREAPWPRLDLRTALYQVDRAGFNAIDYTVLDFRPPATNSQPTRSSRRSFVISSSGPDPATSAR